MNHTTLTRLDRWHLSFFYRNATETTPEIEAYLSDERVSRLQGRIQDRAYIALGGDGTFIDVTKIAHQEDADLLGINFGSKGFLLHDRASLEQPDITFSKQVYPMLQVDIDSWDEQIRGHAFNEVYITRAGDTSSINLSLSHRGKTLPRYRWDGLMVSTPAGSSGWSRSYGGIVLPHDANMNVVTPIGKMSPSSFQSFLLSDKWRIRISNDTARESPLDILADNRRIVSLESWSLDIVIERAARWVSLLIASSYQDAWAKKPYQELGFL